MGAAYCARRMCPWNSKKERSSAVVASRWMLPTLTLVFSMAAAPGFFLVGGPGQTPAIIRRLVPSISPLSTASQQRHRARPSRIYRAAQPCFSVMQL